MSITPMRYQDRFSIKKQYSFPGRKGFRIRRAAAPEKVTKAGGSASEIPGSPPAFAMWPRTRCFYFIVSLLLMTDAE